MPKLSETRSNHARNSQQFKTLLLQELQKEKYGRTPSQLADTLNIARCTAKKYLRVLQTEEQVVSYEVGPYTVYVAEKHDAPSLYKELYCGALKAANLILSKVTDNNRIKIVPLLRNFWDNFPNAMMLPGAKEIPHMKGQPTPELFEHLLATVHNILCEFGLNGVYPSVEIIPPVGNLTPMTRLIQLKDPGFIRLGGSLHYYLIAELIQKTLNRNPKTPVIFRVAQDIQPHDTYVYFEVGFLEHYLLDVWIVEQRDTAQTPRHYLEIIRNFFARSLRIKLREYFVGDTLHYEMKGLDNRQVEQFLTIFTRVLQHNFGLLKKFQLKSTAKWLPFEDWPDPPYLVVSLASNVGFTFNNHLDAIRQIYPHLGYCVHFEISPQGLLVSFQKEQDFDTFFIDNFDEAVMREHYLSLGITYEEFLQERKKNLEEILLEIHDEHSNTSTQK